MTFRHFWTAAPIGALWLIAMAALGFGAITASIALADHPAIRAAIAGAPPHEIGVPGIDVRRFGFLEGTFPECAALSLILHEDAAPSALAAAVQSKTILPPPTTTICHELQRALGDESLVTWFTYARYWHGFLLLHRAVLSVADYATLQALSVALVALALVGLFVAVARRVSLGAAIALVGPFAVLSDAIAIGFSPAQAVSVIALVAISAAFALAAGNRDGHRVLIAAAIAGGAYNYFDFFCNPECLATLCAWCWAASGVARGERRSVRDTLLVFATVIAGYGAFWAMKWVIATVYGFAGGEVYLFNSGDFQRWAPAATEAWLPGKAWLAVLGRTFDTWWKSAVGVAVVAFVLWTLNAGSRRAVPLVLLAPIPAGWLMLEALAGHTMAHPAMMFRLVPLSLALLAASAMLARQTMPAARKPAMAAAS